jgi:glycosyltransferase involved in cell wall biosynthesis
MPTRNRCGFIPRAIRCFQAQQYPADWVVELLILDDSTEPVKPLLPDDPRIKYTWQSNVYNHGIKLNQCIELASGAFLLVWDDDDVYSTDRLARQIQPMIDRQQVQMTGTSTLYYYRKDMQKAWQYTSPKSIGWLGAIAFRKSVWEQNKFDHIVAGADYNLQRKLPAEAKLDLFDPKLVIASIHDTNACRKNFTSNEYKPVPFETIQQLVGGDL